MFTHYIKIAVRQLLKYKFHSMVSVLCMALGLTLYGFVGWFLEQSILPENEVLATDGDDIVQTADLKQLMDRNIKGLQIRSASIKTPDVIAYVDDNKEDWYDVNYQAVTPLYFRAEDKARSLVVAGNDSIGEGEAIISKGLAGRMFGYDSPIGKTLTITQGAKLYADSSIQEYFGKTYRIVGVVKAQKNSDNMLRVYLPMQYNEDVCQVIGFLEEGYSMSKVQKQLDAIEWKKAYGGEPFKFVLYYMNVRDASFWAMYALATFLSLLIFVTGLVNFMKFMIQMFYTRQRELALRKCVGSDNKGLYFLLAAEVTVMLGAAFFLSCITTELTNSYIQYMNIVDISGIPLVELIQWQGIAIVVALAVSLLVILIPIWNLRRLGMKGSMMRKRQGTKARMLMFALQFAVSVIFLALLGAVQIVGDMEQAQVSNTLSEDEMDRIISLQMTMKNWENIRPQLEKLPEVASFVYCSDQSYTQNSMAWREYKMGEDTTTSYARILATGDPGYFEMFNIPMEGKVVGREEENYVYVDKVLHEKLKAQEDFDGSIMLDFGRKYQIAGVFEGDMTKEKMMVHLSGDAATLQGTIFNVSRAEGHYYYKIKEGVKTKDAKKAFEAVYRQYVPETVEVVIPTLKDEVAEHDKPVRMVKHLMYLLTFISLVIMILSVYSSISLDATTRQKEVAIRKINGARSVNIVMQFLRPFMLTYVITFLLVYSVIANVLPEPLFGAGHVLLFPVSVKILWGLCIFIVSVALLALVTWHKIMMIMKVNPAEVIRRE